MLKEVQIRCPNTTNTRGLPLLAQMSGTIPKTPFVGLGQAYGSITENYHGDVWLLRFRGEQTRDSIQDLMVQTLNTSELEVGEPYAAPPMGLWVNTYDGSELVESLIVVDDLRSYVHVIKNALMQWRNGSATAIEVKDGHPTLYTPVGGVHYAHVTADGAEAFLKADFEKKQAKLVEEYTTRTRYLRLAFSKEE